jgi:hypothetical protein
LFRRNILDEKEVPFGTEFGTGGEDVDFFRRMMNNGCVFAWCKEAVVYETIPPKRCTRSYLLRRALLRGRNFHKIKAGRGRKLVTSFIAIPVYALALPFLCIAGDHYFMKYMIKLCDHIGRFLTLMRLNPVRERDI